MQKRAALLFRTMWRHGWQMHEARREGDGGRASRLVGTRGTPRAPPERAGSICPCRNPWAESRAGSEKLFHHAPIIRRGRLIIMQFGREWINAASHILAGEGIATRELRLARKRQRLADIHTGWRD